MAIVAPGSDEAQRIDAALAEWRQGDVAFDEDWFIHIGDPANPLSASTAEANESGLQAITSEVAGLVVVSQTCDIVRSCVDRPYVEVAPLINVDPDKLYDIQRGRRPAYATLPALVSKSLAVDLDRIMTVEKSIAAKWKRAPGYTSDADGRAFAQALARKRVRFAFPDDFTTLAKKLQNRLTDKHDKDSPEGRGLRALREIRVQASPSWNSADVDIFFWFIRNSDELDVDGNHWATLLKEWLKFVRPSGRFKTVEGQVVALEDMTAAEHVDSDPLDLDHLSGG